MRTISFGLRASVILMALCPACSRLTDVQAPDLLQPSALENAVGAEALRAGALRSFALAYAGSPIPGQVAITGVMADEFSDASFQGTRDLLPADQRNVPEPSSVYPYAQVQLARQATRAAGAALAKFAPTPQSRIGQMLALTGYTEILLGENLCSGIPLGDIVDGRPVFGTPLNTSQMFEHAITQFDSAITVSADSTRILNLARVGRGRALLNLGRFADAATAVGAVPTSDAYTVEYAATVQPNGLFELMNTLRSLTVADREGGNGLDFRSASDPRVPTRLAGKSPEGLNVYAYTPYASLATPVPLSTGIEARLIEAEAQLNGGNAAGALATLNALRATAITPALPPLALQSTEAGRVDQLFRERAFWLFATGHRHGDLRRMVRQYGRPVDSVFPVGTALLAGVAYGTSVTFTPDETQATSPNFTSCINRGA
jgi:hypothetical protein